METSALVTIVLKVVRLFLLSIMKFTTNFR
jgi:hypothetical protein